MIKPTEIKLLQKPKVVEITFEDNQHFTLSCEYLRVHSPSAEVRGHGPDTEVLQTGKKHVNIINIEPVGNYAVKLFFDDGHSSGIYSWETLYDLGSNQQAYWQVYLDKLAAAGASREPEKENTHE